MTIFVPLEPASEIPPQPTFLLPSSNHQAQLSKAIQAIMKARRIVIICGAGISVQAGIPDFRSSEGLFQTIKRDNPREAMTSGKELFDASVFNSENKTTLFYQMIAQLSDLSHAAEPTAFHNVLRALDNRGRLLRVYTQNIDAIEQKSGLSFGVPDFDCRRSKTKLKKAKVTDIGGTIPDVIDTGTQLPPSRLPSPPVDTPRCIPLHGTLQSMHCHVCNHAFPLSEYLPSLASGQPPPCPECTDLELARKLVGKRPRGIGRLRPSVVLYNEEHKDGEGVGEVVQRDLMGSKGKSGADLLLVVGTSLKVPGTKRMVREFSKAVKARSASSPSGKLETGSTATYGLRSSRSTGLVTPTASPRRTPAADDDVQLPKSIYLNLDFPVPTREWEGVFDVWIQGDAQLFAETLQAEIDKEAIAKEIANERRRRKDEEASVQDELPDLGRARERKATMDSERVKNAKSSVKRKLAHESEERHIQNHTPSRKQKTALGLQTPPRTPPILKHILFQKRRFNPPIVEIPRLVIRLPVLNPQSASSYDNTEVNDVESVTWPGCRRKEVSPRPPISDRFSSASTSSDGSCTRSSKRTADKKARRIKERSHLACSALSPPRLSGSSALLSCHQESQLCPSLAQFHDGQDGDFDPSLSHSTATLMDITVGGS